MRARRVLQSKRWLLVSVGLAMGLVAILGFALILSLSAEQETRPAWAQGPTENLELLQGPGERRHPEPGVKPANPSGPPVSRPEAPALLWPDAVSEPSTPYLRLEVDQTHDGVEAWTSFGATVGITVTDALDNVKGTASGVALREGGAVWVGDFDWGGSAPDIVVGDRLDGSSSDGSVATATVITITGQVDTEANTLNGQVLSVRYPATMRGEIGEEGAPAPETQTDDQGHFTLDFNPFDIEPWMEVAAWYIQPDGNWVGAGFRAPYLTMRVNQTHDWVDAGTSLGATVVITVTDALGNVKGTASGVALREGGAVWAGDFDWGGGRPEIVVGDRVDGSSSDGSVATATVITITGQVDAEANTLSGQVLGVSYPATMWGEIWEEGATSPETQTDDQGHFTLDFNPFDIQPEMDVTVWYIQPDGNWVGAGFRAPCPTCIIQAAINAAQDGDTVIVPPGTYTENINFNGKNITVRSENPDDPSIVQATVIDGGANGSVVTFESGETSSAVLAGFTIRNGLSVDWQYDGGGIFITNASPTIRNNNITLNGAGAGGGIYVAEHSSPIIEENVISRNITAYRGGGIEVAEHSFPEIRDNEITYNVAEMGAGINIADDSSPTVVNNTISHNAAGGDLDFSSVETYLAGDVEAVMEIIRSWPAIGAGIHIVNRCSPVITQNTINDNLGGGIAILLDSSPRIQGNTINNNTGGRQGAGILASINSSPEIEDNTIRNNVSPWSGGIEVYDGSSPLIRGNLVEGNGGEFGAGVYVWQDSHPVVVDNIFQANRATNERGGPMWVDYTSSILDEGHNPLPDPDTFNTYLNNSPPENYVEPMPPQGPFPPGEELYVPQEFSTIQAAIDAAESGDTVIVSPGVYHESIDFNGKNITVRSNAPQDPDLVAATVIDGGENGAVSFKSREMSAAKLEGFAIVNTGHAWPIFVYGSNPTIANNVIEGNMDEGIFCTHACSAIIRDNIIRDNMGVGIGCNYSSPLIEGNMIIGNAGGIHLWTSSPSILGNTIAENVRSDNGAGIFHDHFSRAIVQGNIVRGNSASNGAGIYCDTYSCKAIADNIILANHADGSGGGIFLWGHSAPGIENNVFAENTAEYGGAIGCDAGSSPAITNNTIYGNVALIESGGGISCSEKSTPNIINSILWGNSPYQISGSPIVTFSDVEGGYPGEGNIDADPRFVDAANGDYHLRFDSLAIDAGTDTGPDTDFEGDLRPFDGDGDGIDKYDMGADEWVGTIRRVYLPLTLRNFGQ